ncbi:MAG: polysaccharide deacetylase family protein [Bacteroidales bacterium]
MNYYFDIVLGGIEEFCHKNAIPFHRETLFDEWKVMLTHDVDRVKTYSLNEIAYKSKQFMGISPSQHSKIQQFRLLIKYVNGFLTRRWNNPHWDFNILRECEEKYGYKSVFFFLPKELPRHDASYKFSEARIKHLFHKLDHEVCEIGLHGPVRSFNDSRSMSKAFNELSRYSPQTPVGIRQHRLLYMHPETLKIQKKAGLEYDTTLGFAAHEGFRNSYCLPFKPYDFENDRMIDIWEIPLIAMDTTLFHYRKLDAAEAENIFNRLIGEIKKFNGIFTFLWHNGFGTDHPDKNIPGFYQRALTLFFRQKALSILGNKLIKRLEGI